MDVREVYQRIQALQDEIAALGPLDPEVRKRIDYKFRLDWNYHSNNIEGGTLTVAETKSIMLGHVTVEDKPLRDILEMRGHDQTVKTIMAMGKGEVQLSEKRIKEIHAAIIHEDDPSLKSSIGKWKTLANEIKNPRKGVTFRFCEPEEVPDAIHKLLDWFKSENEKLKQNKSDLPAPRLAFEFHLRFLTIHPFHDGNGRLGRILLNLILISMGYPPIIINNNDKPRYEDLLTEIQVNGAPQNDLWIFLGKLLIRSLELVKKAIDGEDIFDVRDAGKRLELIKVNLASKNFGEKQGINPTREGIEKVFKDWLADFFREVGIKSMELRDFFHSVEFSVSYYTIFELLSLKKGMPASKPIQKTVSDPNLLTSSFFSEFIADVPSFISFSPIRFCIKFGDFKLSERDILMDVIEIHCHFDSSGYRVALITKDIDAEPQIESVFFSGKIDSTPGSEQLRKIKEQAFHLQVQSLEKGLKNLGIMD